MKPLRLYEAAISLDVSPFAIKAIRATKAQNIGELATIVFNQENAIKSIGQAHIDEIKNKILDFVGPPPYGETCFLDLDSLLRLQLNDMSLQDRAAYILYRDFTSIIPLPLGIRKEAENSIRKNFHESYNKIIHTVRSNPIHRHREEEIFFDIVLPHVNTYEGIIHKIELFSLLYTIGSIREYNLLYRLIHDVGIMLDEPFLFARFFRQVGKNLLCTTEEKEIVAKKCLEYAPKEAKAKQITAKDTAILLARHIPLKPQRIFDLLFWEHVKTTYSIFS